MGEDDAKSRLRRVIGDAGVDRLDGACVAVFGIGGVGTLIAVDRDCVSESNINRQAVAYLSTVGRPKVEVMAALAREINPEAQVITREVFVLDDVAAVLDGAPRPDYIVDAVDTVAAKIALAQYAQEEGILLIAAMGGANKVDPTKLAFADLFETSNCPLCRAMRKRARAAGVKRLPVLYSSEQPVEVREAEGAERRERTELGTMSYMPPIMGQMLAGRVICDLLAGIDPF